MSQSESVKTDESHTSSIVSSLVDEGPQPVDRSITRYGGMDDRVRCFDPQSTSCTAKGVYFLEGEHNPNTVINEWLSINNTSGDSDWGLHHKFSKFGDDFKEASREILGPFEAAQNGGNNKGSDTTHCPLCDKELDHELPTHLLKNCDAK